jgi:ferric-dicitrate binding protein FerR (iron transport regulator)
MAMPDPSWQAMQQAQQAQQIHQQHVRNHRAAHDAARAHTRHPGAPRTHYPAPVHPAGRGDGLRGFLGLLILVAVGFLLARDPELRSVALEFIRDL